MSRRIADIKRAAQSISDATQTARGLRPMTTVQSPNLSLSVVRDNDPPIRDFFQNRKRSDNPQHRSGWRTSAGEGEAGVRLD
jgi:hypothetical protein